MTDLLQTGLAWLHQERAGHMASTAVYRQLATGATLPISVTASQVRYERPDAAGVPAEVRVTDFIVARAELGFTPEPGDMIEFGGRAYEVTPLGEEPCWRWTDMSHAAMRVHTRDTGALTE